MVAVVAAVLPFAGTVTAFGIPLTTAVGGLTIAGMAVNVAGSLLLSTAANALLGPKIPDAARPENIQINSKSATAPRIGHVGLRKVGGNVVFHRAKEGVSYRVVVHGHGEITGIVQRYLNNEPVELDAEGQVTDEQYQLGHPRVRIFDRLGLVPETHYARVSDIWPTWTDAHRLDGLWSSLIICESVPPEHHRAMYPNNEPGLNVLAETARFHDPRSDEILFTENAALIIAGYVALADGFNRPAAFEDGNISEQADWADVMMPLASGGAEPQFRLSGSYLLNEKPQDVLGRMLAACGGRLRLTPGGKLRLQLGVWKEPEFTLGFGDLLEVQEVNNGPDLLDRYNELPARFTSHDLGHVEVDAERWTDAARLAEDGGALVGPEKSLLMCPSHRQCRAVMKLATERDNPRQEVTLLCKPKALPAIYEDVIALDIPQMALVGDYEVASHQLSFEQGLLRAVGLTLRLVSSEAFTLSLAKQGAVQNLPEPDTSDGVPLPQNVVAAPAGVQTAANTFVAGIAVAWEAAPSDALAPVLKVTRVGETNWQDVPVSAGTTSANISSLIDGQAYDLSLAFATPGGVVGDAVGVAGVVAAAVTDAPAPPSGLTVSDAGGSTALVEMSAATSPGLWKTEVLRDGALVGVIYAGQGADISFVDACGAGTFTWAARSVNVSNTVSATVAGPVTATIL